MRILYSVQATGNGHISRAIELLPHLKQYGEVDVFLSGSNCALSMPGGTMYRSKGISLFYNDHGGLDYWKTLTNLKPYRAYKEAQDLPLRKYEAVINDFEPITSIACNLQNKFSVGFGHQASFQFEDVPMPFSFNPAGKLVLKHYARASKYIGLHFSQYNNGIYTPILNSRIHELNKLDYEPLRRLKQYGLAVVYLPSYDPICVANLLNRHREFHFKIYSPITSNKYPSFSNGEIIRPDKGRFMKDLIHSQIVITNAGFETPAEALALNKRLMVIPIKGQYEQLCNAEALKGFGVPVFKTLQQLTDNFSSVLLQEPQKKLNLYDTTADIVKKVMKHF